MLPRHFLQRVTLRREDVPSFDEYPFNLPSLRGLESFEPHPKLTFFVGENGSGKSTLLEAIAVSLGMNAEGGTDNFRFSTRASHSDLHACLRIAKGFKRPRTRFFLRAESYFNLATEIEALDDEPSFGPPVIDSYGGRSLHEQSHGESFMALLMNRFSDDGLYLLDEPEAALSPRRQLAALKRIHALIRHRSQFVIATHSPILMAYPDAWIYQFSSRGLERVAYEETEHYQVTRSFMADPRAALEELLGG